MAYPILAEPPGAAPDFKILTGAMEIAADGTPRHDPVVRMIGSSTEQDLHGDTMTTSALESMCDVDPHLAIFLNHDYTLPDSLFGRLCDAPELLRKMGVTDLRLSVEVETENPNAARTYAYIAKGHRLGCSVGCQVLDYEIPGVDPDDDEEMFWAMLMGASINITRVKAVEWSVVGIPANQRSWVENAIRGLFKKNLDMRLAPAVKGLFPADYARIVGEIADPDQRERYLKVPARGSRGELKWDLNKNLFEFRDPAGRTKSFGRGDVLSIMRSVAPAHAPDARPAVNGVATTKASGDDDAKKAQEDRSKKYGIGIKEGGNVTKPSKWSDVSDNEWGDPVNYAYPMPDADHARNALSRWGDASNRDKYTSDEQSIIEGRIHRRCAELGVAVSEDGKEEKSVDGSTTEEIDLMTKDDEGMTPPPSDTPRGADVEVDGEGNHVACYGMHTHMVKDGMGAMHESTHSHNGDNDHDPADSVGGTMSAEDATDGNINPAKSAPEMLVLSADERGILLARYNALGTLLGLPEATGESATDHAAPADPVAPIVTALEKSFGIIKDGREFSRDNMEQLQHIHDCLNTMCDGMLCQPSGAKTTQEAADEAKESRDTGTDETLSLALERLTKALEDLGIAALHSEVAETHKTLKALKAEEAVAIETMRRLKDMPMGRPTALNRSLNDDPSAARHEDFVALSHVANGVDGTEIVALKGVGTCRHWPAGVMKGTRPDLDAEQIIAMSNTQIAAYYAGEEAFVPFYD